MRLMNFNECFNQLNWLSIIVITILAGLIDIMIGAKKDKKIMLELENELKNLHDIKEIVTIIKVQMDKWKF